MVIGDITELIVALTGLGTVVLAILKLYLSSAKKD